MGSWRIESHRPPLVRSKAALAKATLEISKLRLRARLKLQACLEGEPTAGAAWKKQKEPAGSWKSRSLVGELTLVKLALAGGEPERHVPQSRRRYWSKIECAISKASVRKFRGAATGACKATNRQWSANARESGRRAR